MGLYYCQGREHYCDSKCDGYQQINNNDYCDDCIEDALKAEASNA